MSFSLLMVSSMQDSGRRPLDASNEPRPLCLRETVVRLGSGARQLGPSQASAFGLN
jgi:hypothetical protein